MAHRYAVQAPRYWTLTEYVTYLFASKQTESAEFKSLLNIYGREKLVKLWEEYQARQKKQTSGEGREPGSDDED